ncbi:MAG: ROK family protein [Planctomycetota bacterium]
MTDSDDNDAKSVPPYYWGLDIGGTSVKCGLVDSSGTTVAFEQVPTRESDGPENAVARLASVVNDAENRLGIVGEVPHIGLGAPGPMDLPKGLLVAPPQLPSWWGFRIVNAIEDATGRPVAFLNDASAAAYGEFWLGSGQEDKSMVLLTLGTGVGGGIIVDDELVHGVNSCGSECGHIIVDPSPNAQICGWGAGRGHLEAYASATGVVLRTLNRLGEYPESPLHQYEGQKQEPVNADDLVIGRQDHVTLTSKRVYEAALTGDALATHIVDDTARWLGVGVTTLVHTLDPGSVVLGGAMNFGGADCPIGRRFLDGVREEFRLRTFPNVFEGTTLSFATLGADAGYLGAAGYARKIANA